MFAHDAQAYDRPAGRAYGEPVRANRMIDVICPFAAASAVHVLDHDGGISGNMFFQKGNCGFYPKISASARRGERDDRDGLAFIEIGSGKTRSRQKSAVTEHQKLRPLTAPLLDELNLAVLCNSLYFMS